MRNVLTLQGLLTPMIALVAVYIAYQQYRANKQKLKLDLFDRRFKVFDETRNVLGLMYTSGVKDESLHRFIIETTEAEFLFGPEIMDYCEEIYRRVQKLLSVTSEMNVSWQMPAEQRARLAEAERSEIEWASGQTRLVAGKFKKYLNVSKL